MRTAARLTVLLSIVLSLAMISAAATAFAQPASSGPDGWTTGSGDATARPAADGSAGLPPPPPPAPVPLPVGPPGTVPGQPPAAAGASKSPENVGGFIAGSVGVGTHALLLADAQLGLTLGGRFSPFVSLSGAVVADEDDGGGASFKGLGARLWFDQMFLEGRVIWARSSGGCDFDEPCRDQTTYLGMFGIGGEVIAGEHAGLELRGEVITDGRDTVFLGTLGLALRL
jgi:hypothetical protein